MADPIRFVEAITPLQRVVQERQRSEREKQPETPRDEVSLSHPNDERTLKLLQQIYADALGHRSISSAAQSAPNPKNTDQVVIFLMDQINEVLIEPYFAMTPNVEADDLNDYVDRIGSRLEQGRAEIQAVFKSLDLASEDHLRFADEVGDALSASLKQIVDEALQPSGRS